MSKIFDALKHAQALREVARPEHSTIDLAPGQPVRRPFKAVAVVSNKGGVGKTTIATNLAVYARAMREDLPLLMMGFDDETTLDRMFAFDADAPNRNLESAFDEGHFRDATCMGQYGVEYVPSAQSLEELKKKVRAPRQLEQMLLHSRRSGLVLIDTKSDFEILTRSAIDTSDLTIVVVKDQASFVEARRVFDYLTKNGRPLDAARVVVSLVDLRVKFRDGEDRDVLGHLLSEIRREGYPLFETFISRSPKVESLHTNPSGRPVSILSGAPTSLAHRQFKNLTKAVLEAISDGSANPV